MLPISNAEAAALYRDRYDADITLAEAFSIGYGTDPDEPHMWVRTRTIAAGGMGDTGRGVTGAVVPATPATLLVKAFVVKRQQIVGVTGAQVLVDDTDWEFFAPNQPNPDADDPTAPARPDIDVDDVLYSATLPELAVHIESASYNGTYMRGRVEVRNGYT